MFLRGMADKRRKRRLARLAPALTPVTALALLAGLAVQPEDLTAKQAGRSAKAADSYGRLSVASAEQLREDQCLMNDVLRLGGASMAAAAQDGLNQPPDKLRVLANRDYWEDTPLGRAYAADESAADKAVESLDALVQGWKAPLDGLDTPGGFTETGFHWPPGSPGDGKKNFYYQTGLWQWHAGQFWKDEEEFYKDPTPTADDATKKAVTDLGGPLYSKDPDTGLPPDEWNRANAEHDAYVSLTDDVFEPMGADNARIFLESGGFPKSAPQPDSAEFRVAVENLKARFAACAWRDPIDPGKVLGDEVSSAAQEWQQEIASQAAQRNQILDANTGATTALASGAKILGNMLGNSWVADHVARWQSYWSPGGAGSKEPSKPDAAQFAKAKKSLGQARAVAKAQLILLTQQASAAKRAVTVSDTAEQAAHAIADTNGAPRGRGLLVAQQKAQVTHGVAAALEAMVVAGQTAESATRASASDSATIAQRALAQAAQSKAEFRKQAAQYAEQQAKASAASAKEHRDNAKKDKETAEAKLRETLKAEADAKTAAADAHAKRLLAEAEEKTAKAEKEKADAKKADAAQHRRNAENYRSTAEGAKQQADTAAATAADRRKAAESARDSAKAKRDDAWDAEQKADAARAKADAKGAYADAHEADDNAKAARAAADDADRAATAAESAAKSARGEADAASQAAADADAAATRAEAAASRSRAASDAAQADKLKADGAVRTATSAAADAIAASQHAAAEANAAVKDAEAAEQHAKDAKAHADEAGKETVKARAAAAKAAGFAYATAQAAADARQAAAQVAKPANDAIQLGSRYATTDSAAPLVVLTGQASKTIAEQQAAVAEAHAKNAKKEAELAKSLADKAAADTKAAYQSAARAADYAAEARGYANEALGHAAEAAAAASKAAQSLSRTIEYDRQATVDAAAADAAAGRAEGYAKGARAAADAAALDAEAAHAAADAAEQAARDARAAADRADADATAAEEAAKDAQRYADSAQDAADEAERKQANKQVSTGAGTGVGGVFYVIDESASKLISADQIGECPANAPLVGCNATYTLHMDVVADFYLCTDANALATAAGCPKKAWRYVDRQTFKNQTSQWNHHFSGSDILRLGWQNLFGDALGTVLYEVILGDFVRCLHGSSSSCAWALAMFAPVGKPLGALADGIRALDASARTGIGFADAWKGLRALGVSEEVLLGTGIKAVDDLLKSCTRRSRTVAFAASRPNSCEGIIAYNSDALSRAAYQGRIGTGVTPGRNVAAARVPGWNDPKTGDIVVGFSKGNSYHSENHILDQLAERGFKPTQITELYSERQPCGACAPLLEGALKPGTPIRWSVPWTDDYDLNQLYAVSLRDMIRDARG
ncbi:nucleic acid/nucleotide deaminase domain-containing protein [Streptomyces sp. NPDC045456]|uniref:nucleic acid/nucleotide deaminase domain-containing protein n=1 Tax=Streptomyces sp. NPDC045456 TaxID=3155254 RepID=UPI0033EFEF48